MTSLTSIKRALSPRRWGAGRLAEEQSILATGLPLLLALAFGLGAASMIAGGNVVLLVPIVMTVPAAILFLRYPFAAVILWVLVFPYFVITDSSATARFMYTLLHRLMIPAALAITILADWLQVRKREPVRFGRAELAMLAFLLLLGLNIVMRTPDPQRALVRAFDRLFVPFCMYWLIRLLQPTSADLRRLAVAGLFTLLAQAMIGGMAWFSPQMLPPTWLNREGQRTTGSLNNPAVFTSTLIFLSFLLLQSGLQSSSRRRKFLGLACLSLAYFGVFFSFSRGSWLGGVTALAGLTVVYPRVMLRWLLAAGSIGLLLMATLLSTELSWAATRLTDQDTAQGRVLGATTSLRMIQQKPWFGWGFDTYDLYDEDFKTRVGDLAIRKDQTSHNTYLLMISEIGLVSLPVYLFPAAWWLLVSLRVWRRMPNSGMQSWHLLALLWLLLIDHFLVSNFMDMIQANLFGTTIWWMALGLIASLLYPYVAAGELRAPEWINQPARATALERRPG